MRVGEQLSSFLPERGRPEEVNDDRPLSSHGSLEAIAESVL
jgi:hypothetical protein